jgi:hypothetical protein
MNIYDDDATPAETATEIVNALERFGRATKKAILDEVVRQIKADAAVDDFFLQRFPEIAEHPGCMWRPTAYLDELSPEDRAEAERLLGESRVTFS